MGSIIGELLKSTEPSVRYKTLVLLLSKNPHSDKVLGLRREIRNSERVRALLSERAANGKVPYHPYAKWDGAHWILAALAELDYPQRDNSLIPLRDQEYKWLLSSEHQDYTEARPYRYHPPRVLLTAIKERPRIHASMEGNAMWSLLTLGISDERTEAFVQRLLRTQWPDGGWNCDGNPKALKSSFMETLLPLRGLALHARLTGSAASRDAAERASEVFLKRGLYKRAKNGTVIDHAFTKLHYPCYWHYDVLFCLKVMAETGHVRDTRCKDALDLLESKRLTDGGFPAEAKYYRVSGRRGGRSLVNWGPVSKQQMNEFVTVDALWVLKEARRWQP